MVVSLGLVRVRLVFRCLQPSSMISESTEKSGFGSDGSPAEKRGSRIADRAQVGRVEESFRSSTGIGLPCRE